MEVEGIRPTKNKKKIWVTYDNNIVFSSIFGHSLPRRRKIEMYNCKTWVIFDQGCAIGIWNILDCSVDNLDKSVTITPPILWRNNIPFILRTKIVSTY